MLVDVTFAHILTGQIELVRIRRHFITVGKWERETDKETH